MLIPSQNTLPETPTVMFDHISEHRGPVNLTHKMNHHAKCVSCVCSQPLFPHQKVENDIATLKNWGKNKRVKYMKQVWPRVSTH